MGEESGGPRDLGKQLYRIKCKGKSFGNSS